MASVKLNSNRHESKAEKQVRHLTLKRELSRGQRGMKPSKHLNKFGKMLFKAIVDNNKQLNASDNADVNMLCSEYQLYIKMNDYIIKNGVINSQGKKDAHYSVLKQCIDTIIKLESQLLISPRTRISNEMSDQDKSDPVNKVLADGDRE